METTPTPINELIDLIAGARRVFIQTHNFPDHDAVASAFGLQQLLLNFDIQTRLVYDLDIQRDSLKQMIADLAIDLKPVARYDMVADDLILLVDGCKGNKNVTDLPGREIGVIDHHLSRKPNDVPFADIRHTYGACASIIAKVARDHLMVRLDSVYSGYRLAEHKGYCTEGHVACLNRLGPSPVHRRSFQPVKDLI